MVRAAALRMLDRKRYSEKELAQKLRQKGADMADIQTVLEDLRSLGLVDDQKLAEAFIHYRQYNAPKGRAYVKRELLEKGVPAELAEQGIEEYYPPEEEAALLRRLMEKELARCPAEAEKKKKFEQALARKMAARGFPLGVIFALLSELGVDCEALDN